MSDIQTQPAKPSRRRAKTPARRVRKEPARKKSSDIAVSTDATARIVTFAKEGSFAVAVSRGRISRAAAPGGAQEGAAPLIWLASLPSDRGQRPEILGNGGRPEKWLGEAGGTIGVHAKGGDRIMGLVIGAVGKSGSPPAMSIETLDPAEAEARFGAAQGPAPPSSGEGPRRVAMHVLAHIERLGDVLYGEAGRIGLPEEARRIEGFAIDMLQDIAPHHVQYRAIFRGGVEGPWITGPNFCGTRGRREPLCGFAVRLAPHLQERFSISYCGGFSNSGIGRPCSNGEVCQMTTDDYLVSMVIEIFDNENPSAAGD
ncbi:MAG TPA: hypothetical protein VGG57_05550 [Stellaceae bacterium]